MSIKSPKTIYNLIEKHLRLAESPTSCAQLMDIHEVRKAAIAEFGGPDDDVRFASNKLSDALGFMWRRGLLTRYPAPLIAVQWRGTRMFGPRRMLRNQQNL